jgi:hypothetical protein
MSMTQGLWTRGLAAHCTGPTKIAMRARGVGVATWPNRPGQPKPCHMRWAVTAYSAGMAARLVEAFRRQPCGEVNGSGIKEVRGTHQVTGGQGSPKRCDDGVVVEDGGATAFNGGGDGVRN